MAIVTTTKLSMTFGTADGTTTISYNYANPMAAVSAINALMAGIITNGSIFANVPLTVKGAKMITTETADIDLDDDE